MKIRVRSLLVFLLAPVSAAAQDPGTSSSLSDIPVREITVFKDGHAFVLHSGSVPVDDGGDVTLSYLPNPVIGTFWPFSADDRASLTSVVAGRHKVLVDRTAINLRELIEANVGQEATVREADGSEVREYAATILNIPTQSGEEQEALDPTESGEKLGVKGDVVLLRTDSGVRVVAIDRILGITFPGSYDGLLSREEFRGSLTLDLDWSGGPRQEAEVGLLYLQRGVRWIPGYKVTIDGNGRAVVNLQATLVNELADLENVTVHLVIGVPRFVFQDTPDPIALQEAAAQLSQYFRRDSQTAQAFSNALMTQATMSAEGELRQVPTGPAPGGEASPEVVGSGEAEDLFVFTVESVTLEKGQRMVLPVSDYVMPYEDIFALNIPFTPPPEVWRNFNTGRQTELAQILGASRVKHKVRLTNESDHPLTTAPALVLADDRLLAQGLMRYAAPGADTDLEVTDAVDIRIKKKDNETGRVPNAVVWQGDQYGRVDLAGTITLTSYRDEPLTVEVVRHVLGNVVSAEQGGDIEMVNLFEDPSFAEGPGPFPVWWGWFSWPWWWHRFNSVGRITWTVELQPSEPLELAYAWNYFWR